MAFPGLAHVAVTVRDLERSVPWYARLFGSDPVLDEDEQAGTFHHTVWLLDGGQLFGLHQHVSAAEGEVDATRPGLDHVGFAVADRAELDEWAGRLDELGIEHGGVVVAPYGAGLSFKDPDGIPLELFAPAG
ncbi:VOC family protein [Lapillicoccus jejuensis]|uniref:Catechol 2,3-dioxygenase-like lactoylglutathione lyase family enzyme n=1 Tax=Lapillicoccus jejuensis TaxID=402171 RepID=A0A542DY17_9MICO|nr:VOC family protein [Lapillicoccus jejuensis]TQJ07977.1 catechol 2,3-dioxygenase-like lactoylglutathione lyase family enzyme [Lapillicoccus jejuensis]